jgi:hypothetical protein
MTLEYLRGAQQKQPFVPFLIHMADGSSFSVPHPDFISMHPTGRLVFVHEPKGGSQVLDRLLMTRIAYPQGNGAEETDSPSPQESD